MNGKDLRGSELYQRRFGKEEGSIWGFVLALLLCISVVLGFRVYFTEHYGGVVVDGSSMRNTLYDGEKLLMKYTESGAEARRGDVIVVYVGDYEECKDVEGGFLIKRLIGIEGDKIMCKDGQLSVCYAGADEYVPLDEPYAYYMNAEAYDFAKPYEVGEGEIFFLGDNRNNSRDSRYNEPSGSHLENKLYKAEDIYGIVPDWAIKHRAILEKIFF